MEHRKRNGHMTREECEIETCHAILEGGKITECLKKKQKNTEKVYRVF